MSCAGAYNFCFKKGFELRLAWKDSSGALIDTTGYSAKLTLRNRTNSSVRFSLDLKTANGKIVLGGVSHNVIVTASAADTLPAPAATYDYDLEMTSSSGTVVPLLSGIATKEASAVVP